MTQNNAHRCSTQGLPFPRSWDFNPDTEDLASIIAEKGIQRLLYAVNHVHSYLEKVTLAIAHDHLPPEYQKQFDDCWLEAEAFGTGLLCLIEELAGCIGHHIPAKMGTMEDMLQEALAVSGFCCEAKVDEYMERYLGGSMDDNLNRMFPELQREWMTLEGARQARAKLAFHLKEDGSC